MVSGVYFWKPKELIILALKNISQVTLDWLFILLYFTSVSCIMGKLCHEALKDHYRYDSLWGGLEVLQGHLPLPKTGLRVPCSAPVVQALIVQIASLVLISEGSRVSQGSCLWQTHRKSWRAAILLGFPYFRWGTWCLLCVLIFFSVFKNLLFLGLLLFAKYTFKGTHTHTTLLILILREVSTEFALVVSSCQVSWKHFPAYEQ